MNKTLLVIILSLIATGSAHSLSEDELIDLTAKAHTRAAANLIYDYCSGEDAFLEVLYSKRCKCAIKSGKAKNRAAVNLIADQCGL